LTGKKVYTNSQNLKSVNDFATSAYCRQGCSRMADVIWHLEAYNNYCRLALIQLFDLVTFAEL